MSRIRRRMAGIVVCAAMVVGMALGPAGAPGTAGTASAYEEDPLVQEIAAESVMEDCRVSRAQAMTILRVQDRSDAFVERVEKRPGVVTVYYRSCRPGMVVQVLRGTPRAPLRKLAERYRMARWMSFQSVRFTLRETYRAQREISRRIEPLFGRCLVTTSQDTRRNGVKVTLSTDAKPADVALVRRAIKTSMVPVKLIRARGSLCLGYGTDDMDPGEVPVEEPTPAPPT